MTKGTKIGLSSNVDAQIKVLRGMGLSKALIVEAIEAEIDKFLIGMTVGALVQSRVFGTEKVSEEEVMEDQDEVTEESEEAVPVI